MSHPQKQRTALHGLLWPLVLLIIIADQVTKAYFVYRLGSHHQPDFISFAFEYFTLWAGTDVANGELVKAVYQPFMPSIPVFSPWISFNLTTNTGAAWSLFEGNSFVLSFVSIAMATLLFYVWWRGFRDHRGMTIALGAIIGGALGNFIDRFRLHEVVDFIDVKIPLIGRLFPVLGEPYDFPIFNMADACAVCGTIALAAYLVVVDVRALRRKRAGYNREEPQPYRGGLDVDVARLEELKKLAASRRTQSSGTCTELGLTVHIGINSAGDNVLASDCAGTGRMKSQPGCKDGS